MSRARLFLENFLVYGFISVLDKVIPMLLLPVITRLLSDPADFGIYDMYNVIVGFGTPLAVMGMYDAMFREYFERDDHQYRYDVTATANRIVVVVSVCLAMVLILFSSPLSKLFFGSAGHGKITVLAAVGIFVSSNRTIIAAPTRIQNKRKVYVGSGVLSSLSYYVLAIALILLGYSYYGMIYGHLFSVLLLLAFFWVLNREFFIRGTFNKQIALELAKIGLPLVPVFIFYWIYNSMDRIMIASMLGLSHVGIYAVGTKLASISSLIYAAFAGGWSYFAFSTMKDEGQVALNSKVFEYLGIVSFTSLVGIYPFLTPVFNLIFPGTYSGATFVVPYLYLSPLLLALFQVVSSQFLVIKKSYWSTITLTFGAVSNVLLNWWLIPLLGIEGAAIATAIGYALSVIAVCLVATRHGLHRASKRFWFSSLVLVVYLVLNRRVFVGSVWHQLCMSSGVLAVYAYMYIHELRLLYAKSRSLISGSKRK